MHCQRCRETLSAMTDGQAAPDEEDAAEEHLARCPACRTVAERMVEITRLMRIRPVTPCHDFVLELMDVVDAAAGTPPSPAGHGRGGHHRPCCVPDHVVVWSVGAEGCGCITSCGCGCQGGAPCQCQVSAV
ncbi:zf-HC2 domain-containing protein [Amycolatopsis azurea]|uniref:zf-HC2 domain-containing protein n=1 Tax=Amycolatopsis azurea TaxID=36819 RepID=UPI00380D2F49